MAGIFSLFLVYDSLIFISLTQQQVFPEYTITPLKKTNTNSHKFEHTVWGHIIHSWGNKKAVNLIRATQLSMRGSLPLCCKCLGKLEKVSCMKHQKLKEAIT